MKKEITAIKQKASPELKTAIEAALIAGKIQRDNFFLKKEINQMKRYDIKLQLDKKCEKKIISILQKKFPEYNVLSEEDLSQNRKNEFTWIIDPLDGTVNYFHQIPHFCVSIGLMQKDKPVLGVIYDPIREELFYGSNLEKGKGKGKAFLLSKTNKTRKEKLKISPVKEIKRAYCRISFGIDKKKIKRDVKTLTTLSLKSQKLKSSGSASLDIAYLAAGRIDFYLHYNVKIWDLAAGFYFINASGGRVEYLSQPKAKDLDIIGSNPQLLKKFKKVLNLKRVKSRKWL